MCKDTLGPVSYTHLDVYKRQVNDNGHLTGHITDGIGYMAALKDNNIDVIGKKMTIVGAGGAAKMCIRDSDYVASTYVIPFEKLYEEGYRGLIFDIDNTLVPHGEPAVSYTHLDVYKRQVLLLTVQSALTVAIKPEC